MRIISLKTLRQFWTKHSGSEQTLRDWYRTACAAEWRSLHDVRQVYIDADSVPIKGRDTLTVFNLCGGSYRLIVRIRYDYQLINVRAVLTHQQYDRGNWKE